jgi:outer membrane usher protein
MVRQAAAPVTPQSEGPVSPPVAVTVRAPAILASSHPREVSLAVKINGRPVSDFARLLQMGDNRFYAGGDLLQQWRLRLPAADAWSVGDQTVYRLDELPGLRASLNQAEQVLSLDVPAADFTGSQFNGMWREPLPVDHSSPGLFLNHQLQYTYTPQQSTMAGLFEAGFFSPLGVLTSRFTSRDFLSSPTPLRLDTQLTREFPDDRAALTVGDAVSSSGPWARQVNYAGIRWASDFSTQPYFMPMVLPSLAGSAAEPSTVDIYVNGLRTYRQQIDAGPFAIQNVPVMTGEGQLQMVVTDVMGRQQVITQSYINAQQLLRSGVNEYTYEAGSLRSNFGTASADYGAGFFAGSERHGFSNRLTVDGRLEASWQQQTLGLGLDYGWRSLGVLSGGFAASHGTLGPGGLAYLMFQHSSRIFGYSGSVQVANSTFEQLGMTTGERAARLLGEFQVTRNFGRRGSVSLGYLRQENRPYVDLVQPTRPDFAGVSTTFSFRVANRAYLTAGTNLSYSFKDASSATLSLVVPLGPRTTMLANSSLQQGGTPASTFEYLKQLPIGNGYGYDLRTDVDDHSRVDGTFMAQNNEGTYELETAQQQGTGISSRFTETGSLVFLHDRIMPAQWLNNSFAVVDVPDTPGVKVYTNNQYIASTSYRGLAVVPNLVPYNQNTVRLDDEGVPVDLGMDFSEKSVVPMSRSGVFLTFKATPVNGALFKLVTEKGQPLPVGTEVTVNAAPMVYSIAYRGEVFVSEVSFPAHLHARWGEQRCEAVVAAAPGNKPLPRIGPVTCKVRP